MINSTSPVGTSLSTASPTSIIGQKRKRSGTEVRPQILVDFTTEGLLGIEKAREAFDAFFRGCDRFVPVFDPVHDTFESVRSRSSILFNAICSTGCTVSDETQLPRVLAAGLKKQLNQVVLLQEPKCLETVQALLVIACYSADRSLILSFAARLAIDIGLSSAFDELISRRMTQERHDISHLARCSRTWFELMVLENMLQVDAGKLPAFMPKGSTRRCRYLLQQPQTTPLDLRLLAQVELNGLRSKLHNEMALQHGNSQDEISMAVSNAQIDIELWYHDWETLMNASQSAASELPLLLVNLKVQRYWCEAIVSFRALRAMGSDNVQAMSPIEHQILRSAQAALKAHMSAVLEDNTYLHNLRFAMDFVWAKCAFCFLLVLKLTRLLPQSQEDGLQLLADGQRLYAQMNAVGTRSGSSTSRLYVHVLGMGLEKYNRALQQHEHGAHESSTLAWLWDSDANLELQSFVPDQFLFDWEFPGLNLFSSTTCWQDFFDDYLIGLNPDQQT